MPRDDAVKFFRDLGERYKAEIIASIPEGEQISLYRQDGFVDLCRGPHVPSTGKLKAFKLMKVVRAPPGAGLEERDAAADLRHGLDEGRTRMPTASALEEAEKRDHRKLGTQLDLFHMQEEAPAWCSGTQTGGLSGSRSNSTCAGCSATTAISRCAALRSSTAACGRSRATGRTTRS